MRINDLDYDLPEELIAQRPLDRREGSRMMVLDRRISTYRDAAFADLPGLLSPDDILVVNNTKVFPARLYGKTETGAGIEVFLVSELPDGAWEVLAKPGRRLRKDKLIRFADDLSARVVEKRDDGKVLVTFDASGDLASIVDRIGRTPLPPYIKRGAEDVDTDRARYQTVYAAERGAIAAPTAGLHFTPDILETIQNRGTQIVELTLHVGYGTFEPVRVDDLAEHRVMPERYEINRRVAEALNSGKKEGKRLVAIGTTTTRALESNLSAFGDFNAGRFSADLTITPDYEFKAVDALLTNFHLPKSSLLVLTSVFGGRELIMKAYRHAVEERYRFYSYGDCMLIE